MIFVGGVPLSEMAQGKDDLAALLEHPLLVASSNLFAARPTVKFSTAEQSITLNPSQFKCVYLFQREYAVVDPNLVEFVGTDEATTCVGLVIRNRESGMTSVAHLDSTKIVNAGLTSILSSLADRDTEAILDVHLIGGFDDGVYQSLGDSAERLARHGKKSGYSLQLVSKIVEALQNRAETFHLQTFCVLSHNTRRDSKGIALPINNGLVVETSTGSVSPANFDRSTRCPDEIVRRLRVSVSSLDPNWKEKLLETYDTRSDEFWIAPCSWSQNWRYYALSLQNYSDDKILRECSTSPSAEGHDFVENVRRVHEYILKYPDWSYTFPMNKPRIFKRNPGRGWVRCD